MLENPPSEVSDIPAIPGNVLSMTGELRSILKFIHHIADESYIVGGFVRDHRLNRQKPPDIDIALSQDGFQFSQNVHAQFPELTSFAPLDPVNGCGRLIVKDSCSSIIDISRFKGPSIYKDLSKRDFTINSMAVKLGHFLDYGVDSVLDPLNATEDLANCVIRVCSDHSFSEDPLRILRAYRFSAQLGFSLDPHTESLIQDSVPYLDEVSGERLRDELYMILSCPDAYATLASMEKNGVITSLFPQLVPMKGCGQNRYHCMNVWEHSMECIAQMQVVLKCPQEVFGDFRHNIMQYLDFEICPGRTRLWLIKLACLFHDSGKPHTRSVDSSGSIHFYGHEKLSVDIFRRSMERLRISKKENELVSELIRGHMRLASVTTLSPSPRFLHRLTERFRGDIPGLLLIFVSDLKSSRGPARTDRQLQAGTEGVNLILRNFYDRGPQPPKPLLDGHDLMSIFGLPQSPQVGKLLRILREKQALGEITSQEQAIDETRKIIERPA